MSLSSKCIYRKKQLLLKFPTTKTKSRSCESYIRPRALLRTKEECGWITSLCWRTEDTKDERDSKTTKTTLDMGGIVIRTTEGFLSEISPEEVKMRIQDKIEQKEPLENRDLMELIILPLTYKGKENQQKAVYEAVDLVKGIEDESVQVKALAGILSFSDKIIDKKLASEVRGCLGMTKVGAIIAREVEEGEERGRKAGKAEGRASSLLTVLSTKGEVPKKLEKKIQAQAKNELLDEWLKIAAIALDVGAFEEQITG